MVNASLNWASIVGILLFFAGCVPFFLSFQFQKKYDFIITGIFWVTGAILFFQGWRLDPVLQFGQFLLAGLLTFIGYENIKLRKSLWRARNPLRNNNSETKEPWEGEEIPDNCIDSEDQIEEERAQGNNIPVDFKENDEFKDNIIYRNVGKYKPKDLMMMTDDEIYKIVKLQLQLLTTGKRKSKSGEVEYLKYLLKEFK